MTSISYFARLPGETNAGPLGSKKASDCQHIALTTEDPENSVACICNSPSSGVKWPIHGKQASRLTKAALSSTSSAALGSSGSARPALPWRPRALSRQPSLALAAFASESPQAPPPGPRHETDRGRPRIIFLAEEPHHSGCRLRLFTPGSMAARSAARTLRTCYASF